MDQRGYFTLNSLLHNINMLHAADPDARTMNWNSSHRKSLPEPDNVLTDLSYCSALQGEADADNQCQYITSAGKLLFFFTASYWRRSCK